MSLQERFDEAPRRRDRKPASLFRFLTGIGGLKPDPELRVILDGSNGWMIRRKGKTLDQARAACVEAGYLKDVSWNDGCSTSTIRDLLELIDAEARGFKQYPNDYAREIDPDYDPEYEAWLQDNCGAAVDAAAPCHPASTMPERTQGRRRMAEPDNMERTKAVSLLAKGELTLAEIAELTGNSRQLVRYWAERAGIDATATRRKYIENKWGKGRRRK